jgi:hypothetical protein
MNINENDDNVVEDFDLLPELPEEVIKSEQNNSEEINENDQELDEGFVEENEQESEEEPEEDSEEDLFAAQSLYSMLKERNLVPDKEINSWDELEAEIDSYKDNLPDQVRESIIKSTSPIAQSFVDFVLNKPELTEEDLMTYLEAYQADKNSGEISNNDDARKALRPALVSQWGESTADIMLDSLEDDDSLVYKAKELSVSKKSQLNEQAIQDRRQMELNNNQFIESIYSEFDNQPWKESHKTQIKDYYQSGRIDKTIQDITKDPKSLVQLVNILNYYDPQKKEFNLDTYFNKAATQGTNTIRENIKKGLQNRGSNTKVKKDQQGFDPTKFELA